MIDINKKYRTLEGHAVTIVSTAGPYEGFPVVGYVHSAKCSMPMLCHWGESGGYPANTGLDLIEVREPVEFQAYVDDKGGKAFYHFTGARRATFREVLP